MRIHVNTVISMCEHNLFQLEFKKKNLKEEKEKKRNFRILWQIMVFYVFNERIAIL